MESTNEATWVMELSTLFTQSLSYFKWISKSTAPTMVLNLSQSYHHSNKVAVRHILTHFKGKDLI